MCMLLVELVSYDGRIFIILKLSHRKHQTRYVSTIMPHPKVSFNYFDGHDKHLALHTLFDSTNTTLIKYYV